MLYANQDSGLESRLQAALDTARGFDAHISCVQVTPFDSFIMGDPFGGVYALPSVLEEVRKAEDEHRSRIEARLRVEGASWDWMRYDGSPAQIVADRARLSDLIVLSLPGGGYDGPQSMVADVALHVRAPVLAVPQSSAMIDSLGTAVVAWNGALEAAHAVRLALPMLRKASSVQIVTVNEDRTEFPATDASQYLARHGIRSELHEWSASGRGIAESLTDAAATLGASYLVMGAYGRSRLRESLLGGTTRAMIQRSKIPLLLAH
jgi:nucleotide-binding universal stress UspA family protein